LPLKENTFKIPHPKKLQLNNLVGCTDKKTNKNTIEESFYIYIY